MSNKKRGALRIGGVAYEFTPLGIVVLVILLLAILGGIGFLVYSHVTGQTPDETTPTNSGNLQVVVQTIEPTAAPTPVVTPTPTPVPTPTPEPTLRTATIRTLGEIVADNDVLKAAYVRQQDAAGNDTSTFDFGPMFDMIGESIGSADYTVAEVDGTMGGKGVNGYRGKEGQYNTPPHVMLALRENGVDLLTLANDHALDELYDGLTKTLANCEQAEMDYVGANASQEQHDTPKIVEINGIHVAFLNYAESFNGAEKNAAREALEFGINYYKNADCAADVTAAREAGADVVVAYVSWGDQDSAKITDGQKVMAKDLISAGVDVLIGFNPRVLVRQPYYWFELDKEDGSKQRTLVLASIGTFLSASRDASEDHGMIFEFTINETEHGVFEIESPTYIPTYVWRTEGEDGINDYKVLAVGDWLTAPPEGMSNADYERLKAVWSEMQEQLGTTELNITAH